MKKLLQQEENKEQFMRGYADYLGKTLKEQNQQIIDIANNIQETFSVLKNKMLSGSIVSESSCYSSELSIEEKGETVMKGITKRKDGRYMIRKTVNGVPIVKYAHTKEEARQIYVDIKRGKIKPKKKTTTQVSNKFVTVSDYATRWLETYKKPFLKPKNYSAVKSFIGRFTKELGDRRLRDLTTEEIQMFLNTLERGRFKEKVCTYVNSMLQQACDTSVIKNNPFKAVVKDKKVKCKSDMYLYDDQVKIINKITGTDIEHEIITYLMCGCRPAELPQKEQFDFNNNLLHIYGTKNDNAEHRIVEMSAEYAEYMQSYFKQRDMQPQPYVSKKFRDMCAEMKIEKATLYRLRHTFASNHFTLQTQPKYVQQWLGHASISVTLDTYTDIDRTATKEKIIKLYNNFYYQKI